jgi:hypothetical protein
MLFAVRAFGLLHHDWCDAIYTLMRVLPAAQRVAHLMIDHVLPVLIKGEA